MNVLIASGHLGSDAEVRHTKTGTAITSFSLPIEAGFGDYKTVTWAKCSLWGKKEANEPHGLTPYLLRGTPVVVQGEVAVREWDKNDGSKGWSLEINVRDITFTAPKGDKPRQRDDSPEPQAPATQGDIDDDIPF